MSTQPSHHVPSRLSRRGLIAGAVALPAAALLQASPAAAQASYASYLMAHFIGEGSGGEQIYLSHSDNGLNWTDLNRGQIVRRRRPPDGYPDWVWAWVIRAAWLCCR